MSMTAAMLWPHEGLVNFPVQNPFPSWEEGPGLDPPPLRRTFQERWCAIFLTLAGATRQALREPSGPGSLLYEDGGRENAPDDAVPVVMVGAFALPVSAHAPSQQIKQAVRLQAISRVMVVAAAVPARLRLQHACSNAG